MQLKSLLKENEKDSLISKFQNKIKQKENEIKQRENVISNLNEEGTDLANQVIALEKERNYLLNELNSTKNLESGVFSIKEKDYIKKIESYKNTIKEFQSEAVPLYEEYTKLKDRLSHKDNLLKKQLKVIRQLNERKNKLEEKLNYEMIKEPEVIREENIVYLGKDNVNISSTIGLLTNISRKKQGYKKLTWRKWLDIPENVYLLNLNETIAKKIFNESNYLIQEAIDKSKMVEGDSRKYEGLKGQTITPVYGLAFDGERQSLNTTFPSNHDTDPTPIDRTYSWWMKSDVTGANRSVFGYGDKTRESFHLNYTTSGTHKNKPNLWLGHGAGEDFYRYWDDTSAQDDGNWHHWMLTVDVSDIEGCKLYVDGTEIAGGTTNHNDANDLNDHADELTIGASDVSNTAGEHFEGSITNFAVFTGLLSAADASSHYNNGIPKDLNGETNLEGYWKMDENSGTTVTDSVGGRNGEFDGDEPTWITAMEVTNTHHKGKSVKADMSKNERG